MRATSASRGAFTLAGLAGLLALALLAGVALGAVPVSPADAAAAIGRAVSGAPRAAADAIIVDIRLPRVVLAALVGACLALAGVLYQALFRNPLADPYILGVSSGAGLGAVLAITATATVTGLRAGAVPLASFAGALLTIALVVRVASWTGRLDATSLLLAGVAFSYALSALTSFVMVFARESMQAVVFWMMGGLTGANWDYVLVVLAMLAVGAVVPLTNARALNVMLLGDDRARELGVPVERFRIVILATGSLLVAAAVSVSGLIGFIGLMTPHIIRLVLGPDHRTLVPASALGGATMLVLADLAARTVLAPVELPVGIITALVGGPFFVWLLIRGGRR